MSAKDVWHDLILSVCIRVHPRFFFPFGHVYLPDVGILRATAKMVIANSPRAWLLSRPSAKAVINARVAELVDALDSGSSGGNPVQVRVLSRAPSHCQKSLRRSIPPEAFDCGGSHPPLFGCVMQKRRYPVATRRPAKQSRPSLLESFRIDFLICQLEDINPKGLTLINGAASISIFNRIP